MYASGAGAGAIRAAIEAKYRPVYHSMTPTPPVKTEDGRRKMGR